VLGGDCFGPNDWVKLSARPVAATHRSMTPKRSPASSTAASFPDQASLRADQFIDGLTTVLPKLHSSGSTSSRDALRARLDVRRYQMLPGMGILLPSAKLSCHFALLLKYVQLESAT
jgi:hypothetical protein